MCLCDDDGNGYDERNERGDVSGGRMKEGKGTLCGGGRSLL